jgi:hypothetical protein
MTTSTATNENMPVGDNHGEKSAGRVRGERGEECGWS